MRIARPKPRHEQRYTITAIGEVLWDVFPTGPRFGGAPANFACTLAGLARERAVVSMVSAVGTDELGSRALTSLREQDVQTNVVSPIEKPTGQVFISLDEDGSATYRFADDTAWDHLVWSDDLATLASNSDVVCFGTLGQRSDISQATIQRFAQSTPDQSWRVFDVNLRPPFYSEQIIRESLEIANVLKLNDEELPVLAKIHGLSGNQDQLLIGLAKACDVRVVALTRGANGAAILRDGVISDYVGVASDVVDTVGAGDAFTAALVLGLLDEKPTDEINQHACQVAAFVCSHAGATPRVSGSLDAAAATRRIKRATK